MQKDTVGELHRKWQEMQKAAQMVKDGTGVIVNRRTLQGNVVRYVRPIEG